MSRVRVRSYALLSSILKIAASFAFSIAVTRKLPLTDLGILNIFAAAIVIGSVPNGISSFMSPRLAAKYKNVQLTMIFASLVLGLVGIGISGAFLVGLSREIPAGYYYAIIVLTFLSILSSSFNATFTGGLTIFNRPRLVFTSIITSCVKLVAIFYIFYSHWTLISVLISSFLISLSGVIYAAVNVKPYIRSIGRLRTTIREFLSGSWVSLLGYASSNIRSLDSFFIAAMGGIADNALWQVMGIMGSAYSFVGTLLSITYGELLEVKSRVKRAYLDFLFIMFLVTNLGMFIVFFEPNVVEFLRPTDAYLVKELFVPTVLWTLMNIFGTVSQYISTVMQGVDRVDMEREITLSTYWNSLVFFANFAEFISTISYVALIVPMVFLSKFIGAQLYIIDGVILSSWISVVLAMVIRMKKYPEIMEYISVRNMLRDYFAPLIAASIMIYLLRGTLMAAFAPTVSAFRGLEYLVVLLVATTTVYSSFSLAFSNRMRLMLRTLMSSLLRYLTSSQH